METIDCTNCGKTNSDAFKYCMDCGHDLPKESISVNVFKPYKETRKRRGDWRIILPIISGIFMFGYTAIQVENFFVQAPNFHEALNEFVNYANMESMSMVSEGVRFDKAFLKGRNSIQYEYTLIYTEKKDTDPQAMISQTKLNLISSIRESADLAELRKHNTSMNYCYKDMNGEEIFTIEVTAKDYK